jgi:hypothetical protein
VPYVPLTTRLPISAEAATYAMAGALLGDQDQTRRLALTSIWRSALVDRPLWLLVASGAGAIRPGGGAGNDRYTSHSAFAWYGLAKARRQAWQSQQCPSLGRQDQGQGHALPITGSAERSMPDAWRTIDRGSHA